MADITASMVKDLREKTGAGMMDAKNALVENNGDMEAAVDWLRTSSQKIRTHCSRRFGCRSNIRMWQTSCSR